MSFAARILPRLDRIRSGVPSGLGLRSSTLTVRTIYWTGDRVGDGDQAVSDRVITSSTGQPYKVRTLTTRDVVLSGGAFQAGQIRIGPMTPAFTGGPYTFADLDPPVGGLVPGPVAEVQYLVGDPSGVVQACAKASLDTSHPLHWYLLLNPTGAST